MCGECVGMAHRLELLPDRELGIAWDDADLGVAVLVALRDQNVPVRGALFCHDFHLNELFAKLPQFDGINGEISSVECFRKPGPRHVGFANYRQKSTNLAGTPVAPPMVEEEIRCPLKQTRLR